MLIVLSGASAAGKTTLASVIADQVEGLEVHELGELSDRPWNGEPGWLWRRPPIERAIERACEYERDGIDMVVTEGVLGEVLAAPNATRLDGIAPCLVDCSDAERMRRLHAREEGAADAHMLWNHLVWALWLRRHVEDPQVFPGPILGSDDGGWAWERWNTWRAGDERWSTFVLDTSAEDIDVSASQLATWIVGRRRALAAGRLPLSGDWWRVRR